MRVSSIGNGRMLINFDEKGRITDIYYPYIGMENQTAGNPIRLAIWDGKNLFLDEEWKTNVSYLDDANIVEITSEIQNAKLNITSYNFLDTDDAIYYSIIKIINNDSIQKNIKLFFIHDINLYANPFGDTAFYDPYSFAIVHYKSKRYLGFKAFTSTSTFSEYNVGKGDLIGDLYDGYLSLNGIDNGDVNSSIGIEMKIEPNSFLKLYYIIVAARNLEELRNIFRKINFASVETSFTLTYMFWKNWLKKSQIKNMSLDNINKIYQVSLLTIRNHMDINGSIIASSDFSFVKVYGDSYQYCWPRDAAIAAYALDIAGYKELALRHFNFIMNVASSEGFLYHKYNPNTTLASSWHPWFYKGKRIYPIQEDETALEVWAIASHYERYMDIDELTQLYKRFVKPALRFMITFMEEGLPKPSFDLWEERHGIHIYTISTIYGALVKGAKLARDMGDEILSEDLVDTAGLLKEVTLKRMTYNGRFIRRIDEDGNQDLTVDASLYSPAFFGLIDPKDPIMVRTINEIESKLKVNGGIIRYENDMYQRRKKQPNPWLITTLWLAEYYADVNNKSKALEYIMWTVNRALPTGFLPEQVDPETFEPASVTPLVWSHAEFIIAINKLLS
ncbi:MAG: glycoside hydrolase family 15 protein [Saccharolobus sp.]|jgi:GH15 family glucan-1,4-alpha-glucosidase|uniref:glycoside hydrolase family 15 protein n=1 Tax=Saccharolobus sp. TaxID=2100761 RepID=UPI0028CF02E7|nr:glycoside hydrolase family 15 protein [Saccharolobus sp.]MDT7861053.1 glycoside hydrolase family 15 protein [Saccharolobus sp.]